MKRTALVFLLGIVTCALGVVLLGVGVPSRTGTVDDRNVYYPGTEELGKDEIRVTACGTGMPNARPKQAAACWLVELGNGDKFLFDIGTGSAERLSALRIPYDYMDKVFIGHLHSDHFGDLDALWVGGVVGNRTMPLKVWGPSSTEAKYGTKVALDHMEKMLAWDVDSRMGNTDTRGLFLEVTEFDYKAVNAVVYQENGVTIRSLPAIHTGDGPVSFVVEYAGLKVIFGGDTSPNKWFVEHAKGADLVIHEAFNPPQIFATLGNQPPQLAWRACCEFHTSGPAFGKIMSTIQPRHAIAYHALLDVRLGPGAESNHRHADS